MYYFLNCQIKMNIFLKKSRQMMFIGIPSLSALRTPLEEYLVSTFRQRPPAFTIYGSLSTIKKLKREN